MLVCLCSFVILAQPQTGQIAVDPDNPARMVYWNVKVTINGEQVMKPCVFAGPGDPEDFFYNNTAGNKSMLISKGARCTYITAYMGDFGGGSPGTGAALDSKLTEWEGHITALENAGIIIVFFFYDDGIARPSDWQTSVDKIVNKFKHHKLLIWSVAEEYSEALSTAQVGEVAARIAAADNYDHVIGVHQLNGTSFNFNSNSNLKMFLLQYNQTSAATIHSGLTSAWSNTGGNKILNMAEIADHAKKDRTTVRQWNWAAMMGGASAVQVLWMGRSSDDAGWNAADKYADCARLTDFFQGTTVNKMSPHDDLKAGGTQD